MDISPDLEANLTLGVRSPQPIYNPQYHIERSRANSLIQHQSTEVSGQSAAAQRMVEQHPSLSNGDHDIEEHGDIDMGHARQETTNMLVVEGGIGETMLPPPEDTVCPSLDA